MKITLALLVLTSSYNNGMYVPLESQDEYCRTFSNESLPSWYTEPIAFSEKEPFLAHEKFGCFNGSREEILFNVTKLLDTGISVHARDETGTSLLDYALAKNLPRVGKLLIERGAPIYACNGNGAMFSEAILSPSWAWLRETVEKDAKNDDDKRMLAWAWLALGNIWSFNKGSSTSDGKYLEYLLKAANQTNNTIVQAWAHLRLAVFFENISGERAHKYVVLAAHQESCLEARLFALCTLSSKYYKRMSPRPLDKEIECYHEVIALSPHAGLVVYTALLELGELYEERAGRVEPSFANTAWAWIKQAPTDRSLSQTYYQKACRCYELIVEHWKDPRLIARVLLKLAGYYQNGLGADPDIEKERHCYEKFIELYRTSDYLQKLLSAQELSNGVMNRLEKITHRR